MRVDHRLGDRQAEAGASRSLVARTLKTGDVVILDNLAVHKSAKVARILRDKGVWFLSLPPYSPDLNPIEMAVAKLKAHSPCTSHGDPIGCVLG